ncbi:MAG: hypothetical protein ACK4J0_01185 [Candidatus Anstonellaceae archaeon]
MNDIKNFNELKNKVVKRGGFFVYLYFDIHSTDKENMQNLAIAFTSKITNEKGVSFGVGEIEEPIFKDNLYSTAIKVSLLVEDFKTLVGLTMRYMPIAIEIEEPLEITLNVGEIQKTLFEISEFNQQLTNHILTKGMSEEEKKRFQQEIATKILLGKRIMEQQKEKK